MTLCSRLWLFALSGLAITGCFVSASTRFPDSFRVEVELVRFENPGSIDSENHYCDATTQCDTTVAAFIDLETSAKEWISAAHHNVVYEVTDTDNPSINKALMKDICGGGVHNVTLRAYVFDADVSEGRTTINEFDCRFRVNITGIAEGPSAAAYGPAILCNTRHRKTDHRLFARMRTYKTTDRNCLLGKDVNSTIPQNWISEKSAMEFQSEPFQPNHMRLEFQPVHLHNPRGVTVTGEPCGANNTKCHPLVVVKFDTENSMSSIAWNEADPKFAVLAKYNDTNSPPLGEIILHDICGGELDWLNVRVIVKNAPTWQEGTLQKWSEFKTIEEFDCPTRFVYWLAGASSAAAKWGPNHECFARHKNGMTLKYRIRAYPISLDQCEVRDKFGRQTTQLQYRN